MKLADARRIALSLPEATEEPHFDLASFRVKGKIFATVPPEEKYLHVFVDGPVLDVLPAAQPKAYEKLFWGKRLAGLRVTLAAAKAADVEELLRSAWRRRAPKKLAAALDPGGEEISGAARALTSPRR
jgi:hypothetical protein